MGKAKILIVEDEPIIAEDLKTKINKIGYQVIDVCYDFQSAVKIIDERTIDLILLDINLEGDKDGIDLAKYINETRDIPFVFLTSHSDESTLGRAKLTHPKAYLLKPFNESSLKSSLDVLLFNIASELGDKEDAFIMEKVGLEHLKLYFNKIKYLESDRNYVQVHYDNKVHLIRNSLNDFWAKLPQEIFLKVHRSFIINKHLVKSIKNNLIEIEGDQIPLSRSYKTEFIEHFKDQ